MKKQEKALQFSGKAQPMRTIVVRLLGIYYLVISILLIYLLVAVWPSSNGATVKATYMTIKIRRISSVIENSNNPQKREIGT